MPAQLPLFDSGPPHPARGRNAASPGTRPAGASLLEDRFAALRPLADALPATVRMGTSSWSFPGWEGLVYPARKTAAALAREGLRDYAYAVELRDRALLTGAYAGVLARHGAAHVYNSWTAMPLPGEQASMLAVEEMPSAMVRLLLRPGATYEEQREAFAPFNRIRMPDAALRAGTVDIVARAAAHGIPAYVLVNNKAEGSAPLTVEALAEEIRTRMEANQPGGPLRPPPPPGTSRCARNGGGSARRRSGPSGRASSHPTRGER